MMIDGKTALVLEGGGLRGVFTCGVLDFFMDKGIHFPFSVGVSAGACNGLSFMSGQRGRARSSNIDLMDKYHYIGFRYLLTQRCIMDFKLLFEDFPERIIPYDYNAYFSNPDRFVMVATNCLTGKAEYLEERSSSARVMDIVRASSSLPFASPITYVDGIPMLDGGIADSIPVEYAISQGYEKIVVVLTRNKGYRKKTAGCLWQRLHTENTRICRKPLQNAMPSTTGPWTSWNALKMKEESSSYVRQSL